MSLILDALKRSEQERLPGDDVHLGQIYASDNTHRTFPWKFVLILIVLLNSVLLSYFVYQKVSNRTTHEQPFINKADQEAIVSPAVTPVENPGTAKSDSDITETPPIATANTIQQTSSTKPESATLSAQIPADTVPAQQPLSSSLPTVKKPVNRQSPKPQEAAQVDKASPVQQLSELSNETTINQLSELQINTHIYSDNAEKRFVLINMQKYREGQTLKGSRFKIEKITSDGLIIDYGEGSVRLKAR